MRSISDFIIKPKNKRYNNTKQIDGSELLLNSEISDHRYAVSYTHLTLPTNREV